MNTTIRINANDLNEKVIKAIKEMFGNREIEINVTEAMSETDYLFNSPANAKILEERIDQTEAGEAQVKSSLKKLNSLFPSEKA